MTERPILFSAPMVRALLAGRKTQTRRIVKPMRLAPMPIEDGFIFGGIDEHGFGGLKKEHGGGGASVVPLPRAPYGVVGDRLWVKETWARRLDEDAIKPTELVGDWAWYWADPQTANTGCAGAAGKRRPSIFMQRRFSRITLEIESVRVQRIQEISEDDAIAEGVERRHNVFHREIQSSIENPGRRGFAVLWDSINTKRAPWSSNPWVWAISFRHVNP